MCIRDSHLGSSLDLKFVTDQTVTRAELRHRDKFRGDWSNCCRNISILAFSRWCSHNVGFLKFYIFNDPKGQGERTASLCQILSKSLKPRPRYGDFSIIQDGGRRHLGFLIFRILTVRTVKRAELRLQAKFRQNRSNRG